MSIDVPPAARATLDDRPAVELFRLDELAYDEARFAHDLAALAGDRFQNHVARRTGRSARSSARSRRCPTTAGRGGS
ncbi:hypothetical protein ACIA5D_27790 [Actinoplanes sp. NPDC051513]|uniref:hypothetical protein n=1 Tax=Actinoplanes sp. NPDC051513 TaxID=3363908 RepID=UPI0037A157B3